MVNYRTGSGSDLAVSTALNRRACRNNPSSAYHSTAEQEAVATWPFRQHSTEGCQRRNVINKTEDLIELKRQLSLSKRPGRYRFLFCGLSVIFGIEWCRTTERPGRFDSTQPKGGGAVTSLTRLKI